MSAARRRAARSRRVQEVGPPSPAPSVSRWRGRLRRPLRVGLVIVLLLSGAVGLSLAPALLGRGGDDVPPSDLLIALLHVALVAYLAAAYLTLVLRAEQAFDRLQASCGGDPGSVCRLDAARRACCPPPFGPATRGWWLAGLCGLGFAVAGPHLTEPEAGSLLAW